MREPSRITARVNLAGYWQPLCVLFKLFIYSFGRLPSLLSIIKEKNPTDMNSLWLYLLKKRYTEIIAYFFLSFSWYL